MATKIARNDAVVVRQVTELTPTVVNDAVYGIKMNGKESDEYTADGSATAQEIVEGLQPLLEDNSSSVPEISEVTWTEDDSLIRATGPTTGEPFTVVDNSSGGGSLAVSVTVNGKSPNHWIAENFDTLTLPATGDDVIVTQLEQSQSFYWNLDQNAVQLSSLDFRADSQAYVGLPEFKAATTELGSYYQKGYRDTHLKIDTQSLTIGDGAGQGSGRLKIHLTGAVACNATIYKTATNKPDQDEAPVHLAGGHASNTLQMISGEVDIAMLPGYTATWPTIVVSGGKLRCGSGVTLGLVEVAGDNSSVETRSAVTTLRTRGNGKAIHIGEEDITTADVAGGNLEVQATGPLTIGTLNGYGGKTLDLSKCDSLVTVTNMNVYAVSGTPFTINDPNNKLVMTGAASCPNGAQSLVVVTGSGRNVRIT